MSQVAMNPVAMSIAAWESAEAQARWMAFAQVLRAGRSVLMLDYDGTLAPFRVDRMQAKPWAGVREQMEEIRAAGTEVVMVTGRPAEELRGMLDLSPALEIWGLHGAECLSVDGQLTRVALEPARAELLERARVRVGEVCAGFRLEQKPNAVLVHWRGEPAARVAEALELAGPVFAEFAAAGLEWMQFDGGMELRSGPNKGDVVRVLRARVGAAVPMAFLGDELTDETAFAVLAQDDARYSLSVLVRRLSRRSAAEVWLKPPGELREFLRLWLEAVR